nr:MAG TPA: hypothetical protein [Caudoviricetes sp.]
MRFRADFRADFDAQYNCFMRNSSRISSIYLPIKKAQNRPNSKKPPKFLQFRFSQLPDHVAGFYPATK